MKAVDSLNQATRLFLNVVPYLLVMTALAKLTIMFSDSIALERADPVFYFLTVRQVTIFAGFLEFLAVVILWSRSFSKFTQSTALLWLSLVFLGYRAARYIIGVTSPCHCLGSVPNWLPVLPANLLDWVATAIAILLLVGSAITLFCEWHAEGVPRDSLVV